MSAKGSNGGFPSKADGWAHYVRIVGNPEVEIRFHEIYGLRSIGRRRH